MTYNQLLNMNQVKARKAVAAVFGEDITENSAYHIIYDLSESKFRNDSGSLDEHIQTLINQAGFAGMVEEVKAITEAYEHYAANEACFNSLF